MGLFSLASVARLDLDRASPTSHAQRAGADPVWWTATPVTKWIQLCVTFVAFMLTVPGLLDAEPDQRPPGGTARSAGRCARHAARHPPSVPSGVALWAAGHLLVNGDLASLILFGSLLVLAIFGPLSIDAKRRRALGRDVGRLRRPDLRDAVRRHPQRAQSLKRRRDRLVAPRHARSRPAAALVWTHARRLTFGGLTRPPLTTRRKKGSALRIRTSLAQTVVA